MTTFKKQINEKYISFNTLIRILRKEYLEQLTEVAENTIFLDKKLLTEYN